jgi:allantoin racemase
MTKILMIMPVPLPDEALKGFASQIPPEMMPDGMKIDFVGVRNGTTLLDSLYEGVLADAFCLEAGLSAEADGYDAVCINTMSDSGLHALRSRLTIPVVGTGRSSFFLAADLGRKFSVVTMWPEWYWLYEKLAKDTGLGDRLASIRDIGVRPDTQELLAGKEDFVFAALEEQCLRAIEEDGADVLILGSTTMHQSAGYLQPRLPVPLINPGLLAFKQCELLLGLGLSQSKRAWPAPKTPNDDVLRHVPKVFG